MRLRQAQSHQKAKVLLITGDNSFGGIKSSNDALVSSCLGKEFEFIIASLTDQKLNMKRFPLHPDVIVCGQASRLMGLPNLVLLKLLNPHAKIILQEHHYSEGYEQFQAISPSRFHLMLKLTYGLADRVVAVSQAQSEWMLRNFLVLPSKLKGIDQCVSLEKLFNIASKPIEIPLILAACGRFDFQKGFDILIQSMKLISHLLIKLRIAGDGPQLEELKQLAQGLENVEFVGQINDVSKFLQTSDVVVIPSHWEPWGNVCLEAKAAGKPVIAFDIDGLTEQVQNCGILVPPNSPEALAKAIEHLVSLPKTQLQTWGRNGRVLVRGSWEQYLDQWKTLLWEVIRQ